MILSREKILSTVEAADFIGRSRELAAVLRHAEGGNSSAAMHVSAAPALGVSELLRQIYDHLFRARTESVPVYFAVKNSDQTTAQCALRFLQEFLLQTIAFRRATPKLLDFGGDFTELAEFALPGDAHWVDRLLEACRIESRLDNERAFVRTALGAPLRAAANGTRCFVMIDDLHEAADLAGELDFVAELTGMLSRSSVPYVLASRRRFHFDKKSENYENLQVRPLGFADAGALAENLAEKTGVRLSEQTRDLLAVQFDGNPTLIGSVMRAAAEKKMDLESFGAVQKVYTDEIFGGRVAKFYDGLFAQIAPKMETQRHLLSLLYDALTVETEKSQIESWHARMDLDDAEFDRVMRRLHVDEIVRLTSNLVEPMSENLVLTDYLEARFRLESAVQSRALTVGETLSEFFKRAPRLMAEFYRRRSAIGLRGLLGVFNCQEVPRSLFDYSIFKDELKGAPNREVLKILKKETEKIALPQIVYTAHTVAFYTAIAQVVEKERSAVALGFQESNYTDEDETVWLAAEIDSKLEASKEITEFWCDRLEMVALVCNFLNYKLWLVASEGFSPEATEILKKRGAFGSSRKQTELLVEYLGAQDVLGEKLKSDEYEMIVPMGGDTELLAAQTIEEIARRHHFAPKAINQMKTALVEACINAAEHSLSPDRKIYQKFAVEDDRIIITIANRGLRLADKKAPESEPPGGRRGWGLKLMKTLMDEVKFEQTDDGTRISMTKYLTK